MAHQMHVRPLDINDDAELHAFYLATREAELADNPDRAIWTEQIMRGFVLEPTGDEKVEVHGIFEHDGAGAELVGGAILFLPQLDNIEKVYVGLAVRPAYQRRGAGSRLLEVVQERAKAHGRTTMLVESNIPFADRDDHGHRRFAERHGFTMASVEVSRRCQLPIPDDRLVAWIDEAATAHEGYSIETYNDIPDRLLPSVCHLGNQLAIDAPTGDIEFEAEQLTPEIRKEQHERGKRHGVTKFETVAVDQHGNAVAVTTIGLLADDPTRAHQWITIVDREHRGHRLGLAVKAANLRAMQQAHPERTAIYTQNNESNAHMVAINEQLGFAPVELVVEFQRLLPA